MAGRLGLFAARPSDTSAMHISLSLSKKSRMLRNSGRPRLQRRLVERSVVDLVVVVVVVVVVVGQTALPFEETDDKRILSLNSLPRWCVSVVTCSIVRLAAIGCRATSIIHQRAIG